MSPLLNAGRSFFDSSSDQERSTLAEARFNVYMRDLSLYLMKRFCIAIVLLIGVVGILSRFFYDGAQFRALFRWRLMIVVFTTILVFGFSVSRRLRRWFIPLYVGEFSLVMFASGYLLVQIQDHRNLGIAILITLPLWTVPMPSGLNVRIFTLACSLLAVPGVYFFLGWEPVFLSIITLFLGLMAAVSLFLGHGIFYRLNRENYFSNRELELKRQEIEYMARHDQLSGLLNRGGFEDCLDDEVNRARRYGGPLTVLMLDLDHFKEINDTHGHGAGDRVIETVGQLLQDETRETDVTGRIGGEEFAVLLPEILLEDARELAARIRGGLADKTFSAGSETFEVTCSIGVAEWKSSDDTAEEFLQRADEALYQAKEAGRNRVVSGGES
ncbi:MAG: GGDEF domain-containing protein [bacterium]